MAPEFETSVEAESFLLTCCWLSGCLHSELEADGGFVTRDGSKGTHGVGLE